MWIEAGVGGLVPECYVTKTGYQLECDKPLHRGGEGENGKFFLPLLTF